MGREIRLRATSYCSRSRFLYSSGTSKVFGGVIKFFAFFVPGPLGAELSNRGRGGEGPELPHFFRFLSSPSLSPMYSGSHYSFESKHLASVVKRS